MLEIFFVIRFFLMLLFFGLFVTAVKVLPWLLLAMVVAWVWRVL